MLQNVFEWEPPEYLFVFKLLLSVFPSASLLALSDLTPFYSVLLNSFQIGFPPPPLCLFIADFDFLILMFQFLHLFLSALHFKFFFSILVQVVLDCVLMNGNIIMYLNNERHSSNFGRIMIKKNFLHSIAQGISAYFPQVSLCFC